MKKKFTLLVAALALLTMIVQPLKAVGQTKITDYNDIVSGKTYYIGATLNSNSTDYYLRLGDNPQIGSYYGVAVTDIAEATTFTFSGSGSSWTIQLSNGKYLSTLGTGSSNNGKLSVANTGATFTASNQSGVIRLSNNNRSIQRNNTSTSDRFGSYGNSQTDVWLIEVPEPEPTCTPSLTSWDFGGVNVGQSVSKTFTLTTANLTDGIDLAVYDEDAFTVSPTSIASTATSTEVTITFNPTLVQEWTDYLIISSDDFSDEELIELTGEGLCNAPTSTLAYETPVNLTLSGDDVEYTLVPTANTGNGGPITYSLKSGDANHGILVDDVFTADATGTYVVTATQALNGTTCGGSFDITINVTGSGPVCTIEPDAYDFGTVVTGSTQSTTFTVTTANLTGALTVAIDNTDKGFSVDPTTIPQNATSTTVTVTYAPTTAHDVVYASLSITGGGLTSATEAVITGAATDGYTITFDAGTGSCTTTELTNQLPGNITLPEASTVSAPEGWTFAGWSETEVAQATTTQPTLLTDSYTVTGDATLYAVYSKTEENSDTQDFVFEDIAEDNNWEDATAYTLVELGSISISANGGGNNGKYYVSDKTWRMYNGGSVTITSSSGAITEVSSDPSISFTISNGSASRSFTATTKFKSISVTYGSSTTTYHTSPTAKVATPTIQVAGISTGAANTYYETATVTLVCTTSGATIHYTTNGEDPTASSDTYSEPFAVTETSTIKAIAVKETFTDSEIASQEIIIVQPNTATFTNGVYSSLTSQTEFNTWNRYSVTGDQVWSWSSSAARMSGYVSSVSYDNEDWLITPKMLVENGKLFMSFKCAGAYGNADMLVVKYSTDYPGYGNPANYTWTNVTTDPALPYSGSTSTFYDISCNISGLADNTIVCFAIIYTSSTTKAGTAFVKNFTAKQCYPVTYDANGGTGDMTDDNSPYPVGTDVTVLTNSFTAPTVPADMEFVCWNTQDDGNGTSYYPETANNHFTMGVAAVKLYAIWAQACTVAPTMAATTMTTSYVNDNGNKSWTINLSSEVNTVGTGGCEVSEYGFVYSSTNIPPTTDETKLPIDIPSGGVTPGAIAKAFTGAAESTTYFVRSYATNANGTGYGDVLTVTTEAFPTWTINYSTNGVAETTVTTVDQGDAISTLIEPTAANIPAGYKFQGWYNADYYSEDTAPVYVKVGDAISGDLILKAVFAEEGTTQEEGYLDITIDNFTEITTNYSKLYTHEYDEATVQAYGVYKSANGIQMNSGKGTYIKNTTAMPGYITKFVMTWTASGRNSPTMYVNANDIASTSSTNLGTQSSTVTVQTIEIEDPSTADYKYFYFDGTTVTGACYMSSFKIYYMGTATTKSNYCTIVETTSHVVDVEGYGTSADGSYRLIASPYAVDPYAAGMITTDYDLYYFDQSQNGEEWRNYKAEAFNLVPGKGYLYANKVTTQISFAGPAYVGDGAISLAYDENATFAGWNLIGNPFDNVATIDKPYYRLNPDGNALGAEIEGENIYAMEGVFVKATATGQTATFTPQTRGGKQAVAHADFQILGEQGNVIDKAIVRFDKGETLDKFQLKENSTKIYFAEDNQYYAIVRSNAEDEMPVYFKAAKNGTYTISFSMDNIKLGYLHLIDHLTGANVDLLATPSYTFEARVTDMAARFKLVFSGSNADTDENFAFISDGQLIVNGTGTLYVYDALGRQVSAKQVTPLTSNPSPLTSGVYVLQLVNGNEVKTQKIVVK